MFVKLIETLKANPRTIVFTEGADARILEATARLKKDGFLTPVLVGNVDEVKAAAAKGGFDIDGAEHRGPRHLRRHGRHGREDGGAAQGQDDRRGRAAPP